MISETVNSLNRRDFIISDKRSYNQWKNNCKLFKSKRI